jgi:hypothetical protein
MQYVINNPLTGETLWISASLIVTEAQILARYPGFSIIERKHGCLVVGREFAKTLQRTFSGPLFILE